MNRSTMLLLLGASMLVPAPIALAQDNSSAQRQNPCERLLQALERDTLPKADVTVEQVKTYRDNNQTRNCEAALQRARSALAPGDQTPAAQRQAQGQSGSDDGSRIILQRGAPSVKFDQGAPEVTVQQANPKVTVRQARPEIIVRQPRPTVTVDIPRPEIIVRMPRPDVDVATAQPEVQVQQPQPEVVIVQPEEQPQVQVQPQEAQVRIQRNASAAPQVDYQLAEEQPVVRYERSQPRVVVRQPQGEPTVRFEAGETAAAGGSEMRGSDETAARQGTRTDERRPQAAATTRTDRETQAAAGQAAEETGSTARDLPVRRIFAQRLEGMDLVNVTGQKLGDVDRLVRGPDDQLYLIINHGGFLGVGDKEVAIPLNETLFHVDELMIRNMSDDDVRAMPALSDDDNRYREVSEQFVAAIPVAPGPEGEIRQPTSRLGENFAD